MNFVCVFIYYGDLPAVHVLTPFFPTLRSSDLSYARLSTGPVPDVAFDGDLLFPKGSSGDHRLSEIVGGIGGMAVEWKTLKLEDLGRALWKGKVFYRDQRLLRNRIEDTRLLQPLVGSDLGDIRSEEHTSELQSLMRISYAVFCLKNKNKHQPI